MAKSQILRGGKLNANAGIEAWYMNELEKLSRQMTRECARELKKLYAKEDEQIKFAQDDSISSQMRIKLNYLQKKYGDKFAEKSKELSKKLVSKLITYSWVALNAAVKQISPELKAQKKLNSEEEEAAKAAIFENVNLIKSIPNQYFKEITGVVSRAIWAGRALRALPSIWSAMKVSRAAGRKTLLATRRTRLMRR